METNEPTLVEAGPAQEAFFAGAYRRLQTTIIALGLLAGIPVFLVSGWRAGAGFLLGAALAYLNFLWLKQSVLALTNRVAAQEISPPGRAVVFKFLFRYLVIATVTYVIISNSSLNVLALMAGFFLSVVALLSEAVTEVVYLLRHGD